MQALTLMVIYVLTTAVVQFLGFLISRLIDYESFCGLKAPVREILPHELAARLQGSEPPFLLDVREPDEYAEAHIHGGHLIPLGELPYRLSELSNVPTVVYCRSGQRSMRACEFMREAGFSQVENLAGGILSWAGKGNPVAMD